MVKAVRLVCIRQEEEQEEAALPRLALKSTSATLVSAMKHPSRDSYHTPAQR